MLGAPSSSTAANTQALKSAQGDCIQAKTRNELRVLQAAEDERRQLLLAMQDDGHGGLALLPEGGGGSSVAKENGSSLQEKTIQSAQVKDKGGKCSAAQENVRSTQDERLEALLADPLRSTMASDVASDGLLTSSLTAKDGSAAAPKDTLKQPDDARLRSILATQADINARRERIKAMLSANRNSVLPAAVSNTQTAPGVIQEDRRNAAAMRGPSRNALVIDDDDIELLLAARQQKERRLRAMLALDDERCAQALALRGYGLPSLGMRSMMMFPHHPLMDQMALQQHVARLHSIGGPNPLLAARSDLSGSLPLSNGARSSIEVNDQLAPLSAKPKGSSPSSG
jgi:hypothetical protein